VGKEKGEPRDQWRAADTTEATDLLAPVVAYFEKFVAYGSPFVATAKAIDHGAQGLFG